MGGRSSDAGQTRVVHPELGCQSTRRATLRVARTLPSFLPAAAPQDKRESRRDGQIRPPTLALVLLVDVNVDHMRRRATRIASVANYHPDPGKRADRTRHGTSDSVSCCLAATTQVLAAEIVFV